MTAAASPDGAGAALEHFAALLDAQRAALRMGDLDLLDTLGREADLALRVIAAQARPDRDAAIDRRCAAASAAALALAAELADRRTRVLAELADVGIHLGVPPGPYPEARSADARPALLDRTG